MKATQAIDAREKVTQGALGIFAWSPTGVLWCSGAPGVLGAVD